MSDTSGDNAAVEQLLSERDALHGWLERLDAASVTASSAVRDRVRRDYQQRLDQLTEALREHGDAIAAKLAADQAEFSELSTRTDASRDALAEVELRHAVGEYPPERFEAERRQHLSDIETFELSLSAVNERLERMEEVLSQVRRAPRAPAMEFPEESTPEIAEEQQAPRLDFAPDTNETGDPAAGTTEHDSTEIIESIEVMESVESVEIGSLAPDEDADQVLSVFEEQRPTASHLDDQESADDAGKSTPDFGPLSFRPSGATAASDPAPIGMPSNQPPRFVRPGDRLKPTTPAWPSVNASAESAATPAPAPEPPVSRPQDEEIFSEEIVASGPAPTAAAGVGRTLRCSECGAMNRPLEWYCEKCGAELTAV